MDKRNENKPADMERRYFVGKVEIREEEGKPPVIAGYAALYNSRSQNLGGFQEVILPGAFDSVLGDDVRALVNHDANLILGRTKSGTLKLAVDDKGLRYEITPADTQAARDLVVSLRRGDIDQSSFAFSVKREDQDWTDDEESGLLLRTIKKFRRLYDVSPVVYPAYLDTSVAVRAMQDVRSVSAAADHEARKRRLQLLELEG